MKVKIVTKMDCPSFKNVAIQVRKALSNYCNCTIYDWTNAKPGAIFYS